MNKTREIHPFGPVYDRNSRILILGSFPSVKSRDEGFFYAHPQNRFWKVLKSVTGYEGQLTTVEEKTIFLLDHHIALWDTIASCDIIGSSDLSISNVTVNDLKVITDHADISAIFCNGTISFKLYRRYAEISSGVPAVMLPSTSPANASWSLDRLVLRWQEEIAPFLT